MLRKAQNPWLNEMTFGVAITDQHLFNVATPSSQAKRPRLCDSLGTYIHSPALPMLNVTWIEGLLTVCRS